MDVKAYCSNVIYVENATTDMINWAYRYLTVRNPDYYKKLNMGKYVGNTPELIYLYERKGDDLILPFGVFRRFYRMFHSVCDFKPEFADFRHEKYQSGIELYPYQEKALNKALDYKNGILVMPCGSGKGLPLDAKIYTPNGYKLNGDLIIGDDVLGSDGKSYKVTGIYDKGEVPAYKIRFSDDTEIVCDKDHLWTVQKQTQRFDNPNKWWTVSTEEIYNQYQNIKRQDLLYIPVVKPVQFKECKVSVNPWLLGFLLGDGCFRNNRITVSINENDLLQKVKSIIEKDYRNKEQLSYVNKYDWRCCGGNVKRDIEKLGLLEKYSYEKFIPKEYKYNSVKIRLSILQGLFDVDGYCGGKGIFEYSTSSKQLADDIVEIIQSLGGTAKIKTRVPIYTYNGEKKTGRISYRIHFKIYDFVPFTSEKHKLKCHERKKYVKPYRIIKDITPCKSIVSRCITVNSPDSLYVTDNFVVTHNTILGLNIIAKLGGRALWLTHTQDLLNQSMKSAKKILTCESKHPYGTITEGRADIGTHITFATVQTMCKMDLTRYKDYFDVVIVDESTHCVGSPTQATRFYKVVNSLSARYKYGLTATPKRADGLEACMFALLGDIVVEVNKKEIETCDVKVKFVETGYTPDENNILNPDGTIDYVHLIDDLIHNDDRYDIVFENIFQTVGRGATMILANRVEYLQRIHDDLIGCGVKSVMLSGQGQSKKAKQQRKEALEKLNDGEIDCILATYALASEGLDIPNLRYVMFVTPEKNEVTVTQSAGRVGRMALNKEYGTVIDFVDDFGLYKSWYNKRKNIYKKLEYDIIN